MSQQPPQEHGSVASYVIGFILSLIFTFIPYYLVVNKTITGTALLITILLIAVLQMIIQIVFFLHIGRGPKPLYNIVFFGFTVVTILIVVFGAIFIMNNLYQNMSPAEVTKKLAQGEGIDQVGGEKTGACQDLGVNHKVIIKNDIATPSHTQAELCDTLTFVNQDEEARQISFGTHPNHDGYSGNYDLVVTKRRSTSITLNQAGTYTFHDHTDPTVNGQFTVLSP